MQIILSKQEYDKLSEGGKNNLIPGIKDMRTKEIKKKKKESQYVVTLDGNDRDVLYTLQTLLAVQGARDTLDTLTNYTSKIKRINLENFSITKPLEFIDYTEGWKDSLGNDDEVKVVTGFFHDPNPSDNSAYQVKLGLPRKFRQGFLTSNPLDRMHDDEFQQFLKRVGMSDRPRISDMQNKQDETIEQWTAKQVSESMIPEILRKEELERLQRFMCPDKHRVPDVDYFDMPFQFSKDIQIEMNQLLNRYPRTCCDYMKNKNDDVKIIWEKDTFINRHWIERSEVISENRRDWTVTVNGKYTIVFSRNINITKRDLENELVECKTMGELYKMWLDRDGKKRDESTLTSYFDDSLFDETKPNKYNKAWDRNTIINEYEVTGEPHITNNNSIWKIIVNKKYEIILMRKNDETKENLERAISTCSKFQDLLRVTRTVFMPVNEIKEK